MRLIVNLPQATENSRILEFEARGSNRKISPTLEALYFQYVTKILTIKPILLTLYPIDFEVSYGQTRFVSVPSHAWDGLYYGFERKRRERVGPIVRGPCISLPEDSRSYT
jgi:hypothetical protein